MAMLRQGATSASPRRPLRVVLICRVSSPGEGKQDIRSLDDQEALLRRWLAEQINQPFTVHVISGTGSGERLDRPENAEAEELIMARKVDLVLAEDLGRIVRRHQAVGFCELAEDYNCRVVAINDNVDTSQENWRFGAFFAALRHELYNADTARRIRRTLRNRFTQGDVVQFVIYGYRKPPGAKHDSELQKDPAAEAIFDEWFTRLEAGATYAEVADWLNAQGVPVGPYCRGSRWTAEMVSRITQNPLLKGIRVRNQKMTKRVNSTGGHKVIDAPPEERLERECPHLAFIEPPRFDRVQRLLRQRNAARSRVREGVDPRKHVPRKRTVWPGQHLQCGCCGRLLHYTKSKGRPQLVCAGTKDYHCWNSVTIDAERTAQKLLEAILTELEALPDFAGELRSSVAAELAAYTQRQDVERIRLKAQLGQQAAKIERLTEAIGHAGSSPALIKALQNAEWELEELRDAEAEASQTPPQQLTLPPIAELRERVRGALTTLAVDSPEFGRLLRELAPRIVVVPHQLLGDGRVVLRAQLDLEFGGQEPELTRLEPVAQHLRRRLVVDLFDLPQKVRFARRAWELSQPGPGYEQERAIGRRLGITQPAVQAAKKLGALLATLGSDDPYVPLSAPPAVSKKLRRHRHPRFRFEPLPGFPVTWPLQESSAA